MNIPGYQLGREIAVGEYCSVYNALEIESSKTVTIRFFQPELSSNTDFCKHVKASAKLLLNKKIGHIIPVKQAVSNPEGCYLITEYFPCAQNNPPLLTAFTIDEVLNFGQQLAESLSQLHKLGLVHGGVSTSNLIFPNFSQVTLGSYSFQRTFKKETLISSLPISLEEAFYIAPEFSTGLDARSDFYSLGVILFELLFKTKPFSAENLQQLQYKKEHMQFVVPHASAQKLVPLFDKLLASNPEHRISSVGDYLKIVEQCGYNIEEPETPIAEPQHSSGTASKTRPPSNQGKTILIYSAIAGLFMIGILAFLTFGIAPEEKIEKRPDVSIFEAEPIPAIPVEKTVTTRQPEIVNQADLLLQKAQQQILQNNFGAALMSINNALKEDPQHTAAKQLKQKIELEFEIRSYLNKAEKLLTQGKLTRPENENAYKTYKALSKILPSGDNRVKQGLQKITRRYAQLANGLVLKKQFDAARKYISSGLTISPGDQELKQLEFYIKQQEKILAEQQRLQAARVKQQNELRLKQQQAEQIKLQQQQQLLKKNRLAAQQRKEQLRLNQEKEREQKKQLQFKKQKIDSMILNARKLLRRSPLTLETLSNAVTIQSELTSLTEGDSRVPALFRQIVDSYSSLANSQKEIPDYPTALNTINQGLALDRNNSRLLRIKDDINTLIAEEKERKSQIPIIGTF